MTTQDKARIRDLMGYGDITEAHKILQDSGVTNRKTGQPHSYQTLQRQVLGLLENPALWAALEQITGARQAQADTVRRRTVQNRPVMQAEVA